MVEFNRCKGEPVLWHFIQLRSWVTDDLNAGLLQHPSMCGILNFDRRNDLREMHNLIDDIRFTGVRRKIHMTALMDYMDKIRDPFRGYQ